MATQKLMLRPSLTRFLENHAKQGIATRLANATADANDDSPLAEAEFQTGYSSPTQDAIRKDLNLSLAELCVCFRVCVVAFVVSESGAAGFIIWRNGL
ncbi:hypothetical protein QL285_094061 [Trifolium repens]|nr:hypothetical protein QL285_094061 [Trifolium repens]